MDAQEIEPGFCLSYLPLEVRVGQIFSDPDLMTARLISFIFLLCSSFHLLCPVSLQLVSSRHETRSLSAPFSGTRNLCKSYDVFSHEIKPAYVLNFTVCVFHYPEQARPLKVRGSLFLSQWSLTMGMDWIWTFRNSVVRTLLVRVLATLYSVLLRCSPKFQLIDDSSVKKSGSRSRSVTGD
jgi:hypothetical protein